MSSTIPLPPREQLYNRYCSNNTHPRLAEPKEGRRKRIYSYSTILYRDPGRLRLSQGASLKPDESEGCSPVSGGRTIRLCSFWPSDDGPTPLRSSVDTGAEDRGGVSNFWSAVERMLTRWSSGRGESNLRTQQNVHGPKFRTFPSKVTLFCTNLPPSNPGLAHRYHQKWSRTQRDSWTPNTPPCWMTTQ